MANRAVHPAFQQPHRNGDDYATWLIKQKAAWLVRRFRFSRSDRDDIEQELMFELVAQWPRFDPNRAMARTFISRVIRGKISKLVRHKLAELRNLPRVTTLPSKALEQLAAASANGEKQPSHEDAVDRVTDVAAVVGRLPAELQDLCERLKTQPVATIARDTGVPLRTLWTRVAQLRRHFETAGLRDYI